METGKKKFAVVGVITGVVVILIITLICFLAKPSESKGKYYIICSPCKTLNVIFAIFLGGWLKWKLNPAGAGTELVILF